MATPPRSQILMTTLLRPLFVLFALLSVLTGLVYPLAVAGIGKVVFPSRPREAW